MPMAYTKCPHCGTETREIVPLNKDGYTKLPNGKWRWNPNAPKTEPKPHKVKCSGCGKHNEATEDPKAVQSFLAFNFMEG